MVDVDVLEVADGVFQARAKHVCWVLVVDGDEVTLVDAGYPGDRERVITSLSRIGRSPADVAAVVLTHAHPDHLGSAEYFRTVVGKPVLAHELEGPNALGTRIEQVSIGVLLKMAWRPDVLVWVKDAMGLKVTKVERLGDVKTFGPGALGVPGRPVPAVVEPPSEIGRPEREGDDVTQRTEPAVDPIGSTVFQIRLRGHLGHLWSDWFEGLAITWDGNGDTLLTGTVADQSALHGLLRKIRDLGVTLVSINRLEASAEPDQGTHEIGED